MYLDVADRIGLAHVVHIDDRSPRETRPIAHHPPPAHSENPPPGNPAAPETAAADTPPPSVPDPELPLVEVELSDGSAIVMTSWSPALSPLMICAAPVTLQSDDDLGWVTFCRSERVTVAATRCR